MSPPPWIEPGLPACKLGVVTTISLRGDTMAEFIKASSTSLIILRTQVQTPRVAEKNPSVNQVEEERKREKFQRKVP